MIGIRKLLAKSKSTSAHPKIEEESPIQEIIDSNLVPRLIQFLDLHTMPNLQYEASWCLTNIATGTTEQTQCLTEKGAVPRFVALMKSDHENLQEQVSSSESEPRRLCGRLAT